MSNAVVRGTPRLAMVLSGLVLILLAAAAATATAAEPGLPATATTDGAAAVAAASLPRTAQEQALLAILDEGRAQVDALLAQAQADPARADALQQDICRVKAETNVRFLQKQVEFARASGDANRLDETLRALDNALNPPAPVATSAAAAKQGGVK